MRPEQAEIAEKMKIILRTAAGADRNDRRRLYELEKKYDTCSMPWTFSSADP